VTLSGDPRASRSDCPTDEALDRLFSGQTTAAESQLFATHTEDCPSCRRRVGDVHAEAALMEEIRNLAAVLAREAPVEDSWRSGLGRYRLLRKLGEGGMGIVFEAEQANPRRRVALKVLRPGLLDPTRLARFEMEARILARLDHEGIARIVEADTFVSPGGSQPFFAMELVQGETLSVYARTLDQQARLRLFCRIVDAVQHAHQHGVIHRDLKPQNILVTKSGQPKVLDFGVARTIGADLDGPMVTRPGQLVGTLSYMSPEQVEGSPDAVDTRADVYALGVILYELLTGVLPHDLSGKSVPESARIIAEGQIRPLRGRHREVGRDLETICRKALAREMERRYPTAAALAEDIRRFLAHEPITARPPSVALQVALFARRNRALSAAFVFILILLLGGFGTTVVLLTQSRESEREARRQQKVAHEEATDAIAARDWMQEILIQAAPGLSAGAPKSLKDVVETAAARVDEDLLEHGVVRAAIHHTLGRVFEKWGEYERAQSELESALALYESAYGGQHPKVAQVLNSLAMLAYSKGRFSEAETLARRALTCGGEMTAPKDTHRLATTHRMLGIALYGQARLEEAEAGIREALRLYRASPHKGGDVAITLSTLGTILEGAGRFREADACYAEALPLMKETMGEKNAAVAPLLMKLAASARQHGDTKEALRRVEEALEINRMAYGEEHETVALNLRELGEVRWALGEREEAISLMQQSLARLRRLLGKHPLVVQTLNFLGWKLHGQGRFAEAERCWIESLATSGELLGPDHALNLHASHGLARLLFDTDRKEEATQHLARVLERAPRQASWAQPVIREASALQGLCLAANQRHAEALPLLLVGLEAARAPAPGLEHPDTRPILRALVSTLTALGRIEEADAYRTRLATPPGPSSDQ
jgi:tetratricopeptide (TPR) repeat protein/predicted Ser/Thr protein kinase